MVTSYPYSNLVKMLGSFRALSSRIDWLRLWITGGAPLIAIIIGTLWVPLQFRTGIFLFTYATASGISVTAGLFYSHYGWVVIKRKREQTGQVDVQDLSNDPIVLWQRKHYIPLFFLTAIILPTLYCGLMYGDFAGGFIWASCIRLFMIQQATFCVNSLAHWAGDQPYANRLSPRNSFFVALITWGEGYHNFHHEFPVDYRNGIRWFHWDPTKWFIWLCAQVNLASDLKRFPENEIQKGKYQQIQRQLELRRQEISWGAPIEELPVWSCEDYTQMVNKGRSLLLVDGVVYDVAQFVDQHPGGKKLLATECWQGCYTIVPWERNPCPLQCGRKFALNHAIGEALSDFENLN